jgi:processing peptidase subunit beta
MFSRRQPVVVLKQLSRIISKQSKRCYATDFDILDQAKAIPSYRIPENVLKVPPTQITTLNNGFRVVTEPRIGETAAVGVFVKAGSRNESHHDNGVAHFLEHMYFKGTQRRTAQAIEKEFEDAGAFLNAHTSREYTAFTTHCLKKDTALCADALCDILSNSKFRPEDIENERPTILKEMESVERDVHEVLFDELHRVAYQGNPLAYTILGPVENIKRISRSQMITYREAYYTAPNMTLIGVGDVDHNQLVNVAQQYFGSWASSSKSTPPTQRANYIGGDVRFYTADVPQLHLGIGFEGPPIHSNDSIVISIMQLIWGSYDKQMGASKYVSQNLAQSLAENNLAQVIQPFNHTYSDTSIFGIRTVSDGGKETDALMVEIVAQMARLAYRVRTEELERAKNIYKTQILSYYEGSLTNVLEDVGRQTLFFGRRINVGEMLARIDAITPDDVRRVAERYIYDKDPIVTSVGNVEHVVDWHWLRMFTYQWRL